MPERRIVDSRTVRSEELCGFSGACGFVVDKPQGPTSFRIVSAVRRALGIKKVGHAGTLDPFATGVLVVCAGRAATKLIGQMMEGQKEYLATVCLGIETETCDPEGAIIARQPVMGLTAARIEECLQGFQGEQWQVPPAYSALKHQGRPLYEYARKGIKIEKESRPIRIDLLERVDTAGDIPDGESGELVLRVVCSKGTYIRTLASDIGRRLGCGAYLTGLRRVRSGQFTLEQSLSGQELFLPDARQRLLSCALSVDDLVKLL